MGKQTKLTILRQGAVKLSCSVGYMVVGDGDAVCFFVDPSERAYVEASTQSDEGCPVVYLSSGTGDMDEEDTEVEFSDYKGWKFHAGGGGKSIAIALVRE